MIRYLIIIIIMMSPFSMWADGFIGNFSVAPIVTDEYLLSGNALIPVDPNNAIFHGTNAAFVSGLYKQPFVLGDVNASGSIDVSDAVAIANHVMGSTPSNFVLENADVNNSGDVDVTDVVNIAKKVMGQ